MFVVISPGAQAHLKLPLCKNVYYELFFINILWQVWRNTNGWNISLIPNSWTWPQLKIRLRSRHSDTTVREIIWPRLVSCTMKKITLQTTWIVFKKIIQYVIINLVQLQSETCEKCPTFCRWHFQGRFPNKYVFDSHCFDICCEGPLHKLWTLLYEVACYPGNDYPEKCRI